MELNIKTIIGIILGLCVVAAVLYALYTFFSNHVSNSFGGLELDDTIKLFLNLLHNG